VDFVLGTLVKFRRTSGTICYGKVKKIDGEFLTISGKWGVFKIHESKVITK